MGKVTIRVIIAGVVVSSRLSGNVSIAGHRPEAPDHCPRWRMNIDDLLRIAMERRASDLHLKVGNYPHLRIDGELAPLTDQPRVTRRGHADHGVQHDVGAPEAEIQRDH